jgi:hypothetical protein
MYKKKQIKYPRSPQNYMSATIWEKDRKTLELPWK